MEAIRLKKVLEKDGEISVSGLPFKKGQHIELILLAESLSLSGRPILTARQLVHSGLTGIWKGREEMDDSTTYARRIREKAQNRVK